MNFGSLFKGLTNFQFPYTMDNDPFYETPIWELYNGTRKKDSYQVTIFKAKTNLGDQADELIKHSVHMCKVLRVPGIVPILDVFDQNGMDSLFIITEVVEPLQKSIDQEKNSLEAYLIGLYDIFQLLEIVEPLFVMGNLCKENIFTDKKGKWVYFGLECCFDKKKIDIFQLNHNVDIWNQLHSKIESINVPPDYNQLDSLQLSKLVTDLLDLNYDKVRIPTLWKKNLQMLSQGKLTMIKFIESLKKTSIWQESQLLTIYEEMQELHIKNDKDRLLIMNKFQKYYLESDNKISFQHLTIGFIEQLILPETVSTINWIISNGQNLQKYNKSLIKLLTVFLDLLINDKDRNDLKPEWKEIIYNAFKLTDRQIRFVLLLYLPQFIERYPKKTLDISNRIFNFYLQGMTDTDSTLRLQTLKTVPTIIEEITERQLNNEILRSIAKTQVDSDVNIRMWTILIIVKISKDLSGLSNRDNILATIYTKSLKDPSIKTKLAALYGLAQSIDMFTIEIIANKILTVIAPGLLDKDKIIRGKARELFNLYLKKLEDEASDKFQDSTNDTLEDTENENENVKLMEEFDRYQTEDTNEILSLRIVDLMRGLSLQENDYIELENVNIDQHMGELNTYSNGKSSRDDNGDTVNDVFDNFDETWPENDDLGLDDDGWGDANVDEELVAAATVSSSILNGSNKARVPRIAVGRAKHDILGKKNKPARTLRAAASNARQTNGVSRGHSGQNSAGGQRGVGSMQTEEPAEAAGEDGGWDEMW